MKPWTKAAVHAAAFGLTLALVLLCPLTAKEKVRDWKRGIVKDTHSEIVYAGSTIHKYPEGYPESSSMPTTTTARYRGYYTVVIEGEDRILVTVQSPRWVWSRATVPDVNQEIEYAVEERTLYFRAMNGTKEYKTRVSKIVRKMPQSKVEISR